MMTLIDISKQLIKCAMFGVFACLLWLLEINEARALNYSECRDPNFCRTHNLTAEHCTSASANDCSSQHCASGFGDGKAAIAKLQQKDEENCLSQMPIQNVSSLNISAVVGVRTDTAALHPERGCKCAGSASKCGHGCKKSVNSDGTRLHKGVDVGTGGVAGVKIYAPAQAFRAEVNAPRTAAGCAAYGDSSVTLHHKRGQTNKQKGCSEYWTRFYHVVNPQISAGTKDIPKGTWIADAGPCTGYAIHMHYEIHDCDGTLYNPTCLGETGDPQQLCDPTANQLPPPNDADVSALYGDGSGGYSPRTAATNPYLKEIEDCCQYASASCLAQSSQGTQSSPASAPQASQNDKIIFVGDSRTVGMAQTVGLKGNPIIGKDSVDGNYWIAKIGEGIDWLIANKGTIDGVLNDYGTIVIALGVNDYWKSNQYISTINSYTQEWTAKGKKVYFSGATPVGSAYHYGTTLNSSQMNEKINTFNATMKSSLSGAIFIDTNSLVKGSIQEKDYDSAGLHYSSDVNSLIYKTIANQVKSGGMGTGGGGGYAGVADGSACSACLVKTEKQKQCEQKNEAIRNGGIYCEGGELSPTWQTDCLKGEACKKNCESQYSGWSVAATGSELRNNYEACLKTCDEKGGDEGGTASNKKPDVAGQCMIGTVDSGSGCSGNTKQKTISSDITNAINASAEKYGLSPTFLAGFLNLESDFNPMAKNKSTTASGLGQILEGTWNGLCSQYGSFYESRFDVHSNVMCSGAVLNSCRDHVKSRVKNWSSYAGIDSNDHDLLIYCYFQGPGGLDNAIKAGGVNWKDTTAPSTNINMSGLSYINTVNCHMGHIADANGCEGGTGAFGMSTCPLPPGCTSYRLDAADYAAAQGGLSAEGIFGEEHECNIAESYNNIKGCMFCRLFRVVFDTSSKIARQCHNVFAQSMIPLLAIGLAIVIALIVLKYVSNWSQQDWAQMLNELFRKIFVIAFLIVLLKIDVTNFFNMFVTPIFNTGFKLATIIMGNTTCDTSITGTVDGSGLPSSMGNSMLCAIYAIQQRLDKMMALGSNSLCIAFWIKSYWHIPLFPHFGYLLTGLALWLGAIIFMMAYPFLLIDSVIQFCIASSLFPIAIASTGFKLTSKYLNIWKVVNIFASAMFSFIFLTIILCILLQGIDDAVKPVVERAYSSASGGFFDLNTLMWCSKAFVKIIFFIFVGKSVLEYIPEFAEEYAKAISNGASGTASWTNKKGGIGRQVGGTAANFVGQSAKWTWGKAKAMRKDVAHAKIFGKDGDEYSLADMFSGARMGVGKQLQGTVTGIAYGLGRVAAAKFGGVRHNYLVNNTLKKMKKQSDAATTGGSQAAMAQTVQGRTWWGQKTQRRVITNPDGTMVLESSRKSLFRDRDVTKLEDDHMSITHKTYRNGEMKESYDIKDPRLHGLIKADGTRNQVKMDELMQNSSLSAELKNKIILNQMLKQRFNGKVSLEGKFKSENVRSYKDKNGHDVFEIRRTDKDGNVKIYKWTKGETRDLLEVEERQKIKEKDKNTENKEKDKNTENKEKYKYTKLSSDGVIQKKETGEIGISSDTTSVAQNGNMSPEITINGAETKDISVSSDGTVVSKEGRVLGKVSVNGNIIDKDGHTIGKATVPDLVFDAGGNVLGKINNQGNIVDANGNIKAFVDNRGRIIDVSGTRQLGQLSTEQYNSIHQKWDEQEEANRSNRKSEFSNSKAFKGVELFDYKGNKLIDDEIMFDKSATDLYRHQMNYYGDVLKHKKFGR